MDPTVPSLLAVLDQVPDPRGARRRGARDAHLVGACCQRRTFVLGEVAVADATDELRALGPLLERLVLAGEKVTFDALFTHAVVAEGVVARAAGRT